MPSKFELFVKEESFFPTLDLSGLDLNLDHRLQLGPESAFFNVGMLPLMSFSHSGHMHIVAIADPKKPAKKWGIAFYDEEEGRGERFASGIETWLPAYVLFRFQKWYPSWLDDDSWGQECGEALIKGADEIVNACAPFKCSGVEKMVLAMLDHLKKKGTFDPSVWLKQIDPEFSKQLTQQGSPIDLENPKDLLRVFEEPLRWQTYCQELTNSFEALRAAAQGLEKSKKDSPFSDLISRIVKDPNAYFKGAQGFFEAGEAIQDDDPEKALICYENAIYMERSESEEFHSEAFDRLVTIADKIAGKDYLKYLEIVKTSEDDEDDQEDEDDEAEEDEEEADEEDEEEKGAQTKAKGAKKSDAKKKEVKKLKLSEFSKSVRDALKECKREDYLGLCYEELKQLPDEVADLKHLKRIEVNGNQMETFPLQLLSLPKLEELNLAGNPIGSVPNDLAKLRALQDLNLSDCKLDTFPLPILALDELKQLNMSSNSISEVPDKIGALKNLTKLDLSFNRDLKSIPKAVETLRHLEELGLAQCPLTDLSIDFQKLNKLRIISFDDCNLGNLPKGVASSPMLEELILGGNALTSLPPSLGQCNKLGVLRIPLNDLTALPDELCELENLVELIAFRNQLAGLPDSIDKLKNLKTLGLSYNQLQSIPPSLGNLDCLEDLQLDHNPLESLPEELGNLSKLSKVDLSGCENLSPPLIIGKWKSLQSLTLDWFTGMETVLAKLPALETLEVHGREGAPDPETFIARLKKAGIPIAEEPTDPSWPLTLKLR